MDSSDEYLTIEEASRQLGLTAAQLRRVLRQYGFGDLLRASMSKQVLIRKSDLQKLRLPAAPPSHPRHGAA
jgi:hypothetical protein